MATLEHPADDAASAVSAPLASTDLRSGKEMVKRMLHKYPRLYGVARRGYRR